MSRSFTSSFARALRGIRKARRLTQEEFEPVSGRTYVSALERAIKSPTLSKVDELAAVLNVHPLTLLALSYCRTSGKAELRGLLDRVEREVASLSNLKLD